MTDIPIPAGSNIMSVDIEFKTIGEPPAPPPVDPEPIPPEEPIPPPVDEPPEEPDLPPQPLPKESVPMYDITRYAGVAHPLLGWKLAGYLGATKILGGAKTDTFNRWSAWPQRKPIFKANLEAESARINDTDLPVILNIEGGDPELASAPNNRLWELDYENANNPHHLLKEYEEHWLEILQVTRETINNPVCVYEMVNSFVRTPPYMVATGKWPPSDSRWKAWKENVARKKPINENCDYIVPSLYPRWNDADDQTTIRTIVSMNALVIDECAKQNKVMTFMWLQFWNGDKKPHTGDPVPVPILTQVVKAQVLHPSVHAVTWWTGSQAVDYSKVRAQHEAVLEFAAR